MHGIPLVVFPFRELCLEIKCIRCRETELISEVYHEGLSMASQMTNMNLRTVQTRMAKITRKALPGAEKGEFACNFPSLSPSQLTES